MGKVTTVTCDRCDRDITYTGNCIDYRVTLINEAIPRNPKHNSFTLMQIYPYLENNVYFCNTRCLKDWVMNNIFKDDDLA